MTPSSEPNVYAWLTNLTLFMSTYTSTKEEGFTAIFTSIPSRMALCLLLSTRLQTDCESRLFSQPNEPASDHVHEYRSDHKIRAPQNWSGPLEALIICYID